MARKAVQKTPERIAALWRLFVRRRDDRGLMNRLVECYVPLAERAAARAAMRWPRFVDRSEIRSACLGALPGLVRAFDPARGIRFETFAQQRLHGAAVDALRTAWGRHGEKRRPVSLDRLAFADGDAKPKDLLAQPVQRTAADDWFFDQALAGLSLRDRVVLYLRFACGARQVAIAEAMGLHETRISQLLSAALERLRGECDRQELLETFHFSRRNGDLPEG